MQTTSQRCLLPSGHFQDLKKQSSPQDLKPSSCSWSWISWPQMVDGNWRFIWWMWTLFQSLVSRGRTLSLSGIIRECRCICVLFNQELYCSTADARLIWWTCACFSITAFLITDTFEITFADPSPENPFEKDREKEKMNYKIVCFQAFGHNIMFKNKIFYFHHKKEMIYTYIYTHTHTILNNHYSYWIFI